METQQRVVICVEDDHDDKELFCNTVSELDPTIKLVCSENGQQALEKLLELTSAGITPCLITLDINMPVLDGRATLIEIKRNPQWQSIPVVLYTTSLPDRYQELAETYQVSVIQKPSYPAKIRESIKKILSHCRN